MFEYAKQEAKQKEKSRSDVQKKEQESTRSNKTGIPDTMKAHFENLSEFSFDDVRVHYNSDKPAQLQALAYTQGNQVYIGPGQEKHLGHELGHVIQQKQGRVKPTTNVNGVVVNDDATLEKEADRTVGIKHKQISQLRPKGSDRPDNSIEEKRPVNMINSEINASNNTAQMLRIQLGNLEELEPGRESHDIRERMEKVEFQHGGDLIKKTDVESHEEIAINEDIIFIGHGVSTPGKKIVEKMETYGPKDLANIAHKVKKPKGWVGNIILAGCKTYSLIAEVSREYFKLSKNPVRVIGTTYSVSVINLNDGNGETAYYSWESFPEHEQPESFKEIRSFVIYYTDDVYSFVSEFCKNIIKDLNLEEFKFSKKKFEAIYIIINSVINGIDRIKIHDEKKRQLIIPFINFKKLFEAIETTTSADFPDRSKIKSDIITLHKDLSKKLVIAENLLYRKIDFNDRSLVKSSKQRDNSKYGFLREWEEMDT